MSGIAFSMRSAMALAWRGVPRGRVLALAPRAWPPSVAFSVSGSSVWLLALKLGLFRIWLQPLALGVEAWPFSHLAPASGSWRRSLAFFASGSSLWLLASKLLRQ